VCVCVCVCLTGPAWGERVRGREGAVAVTWGAVADLSLRVLRSLSLGLGMPGDHLDGLCPLGMPGDHLDGLCPRSRGRSTHLSLRKLDAETARGPASEPGSSL
jgi:hypothetical protein